jgi:hypothetical protein
MATLQEAVVADEAAVTSAKPSVVGRLAARAWWIVCLLPVLVLVAVAISR